MTMMFRYGNYLHKVGTMGYSLDWTPVLDQGGNIWASDAVMACNGFIHRQGATPQQIQDEIYALQRAYSVQGVDCGLTIDGFGQTADYLRSADFVGGLRLLKPLSYPTTKGTQHVNIRDFNVSVGGRRVFADFGYVVQFNERISLRGGGRRRTVTETINTLAVVQQGRKYGKYLAVQSGSATVVGLAYQPPPPLWPWALLEPDARNWDFESAEPIGQFKLLYKFSWEYIYESPTPLFGLPSYF